MIDINKKIEVGAPILELFQLEGLNEYKNITLKLERGVKIISAENGSGKTTLLNALYALLAGKVRPLLAINFSQFTIKFAGHEPITATRKNLFPEVTKDFADQMSTMPAAKEALRWGISESDLSDMLLLWAMGGEEDFESCAGFRALYVDSPLDREEIKDICERLVPAIIRGGQFPEIHEQIKKAMGDVSVLYLPTFRRIEADLPEYRTRHSPRSRKIQDDWNSDKLIFFGLEDVERRLREITNDIQKGTFEAYSRISAKTLDQLLIAGTSPTEMSSNSVNLDSLKVMLARLGKTNSQAEVRIMDLFNSGHINDPENESLRYFLGQLLEVYQEKRGIESSMETFSKVIDSYWHQPGTEKRFEFNKFTAEARAINTFTGRELPLGALSSGEKQIISVFARLYLDSGKKYFILIDEPELSLSIEWQQKFLPDVISAPSCAQLVAITHSPFTFANDLDPYAGSLEISYSRKAMQ